MHIEGGVVVRVLVGVVVFFFLEALEAFTGVTAGISHSLSELISEDEMELLLLTAAGVLVGCS